MAFMTSLRLAALAMFFGASSAVATSLDTTKTVAVDSSAGRRLLQKATVVKPSHYLRQRRRAEEQAQEQQAYQYQYQYDNTYGVEDLASLYIMYSGCSSFMVPDQEDGGDSGDEGGDGQGNQQMYYYQQLAEQKQKYGDGSYNDGLVQQGMVLLTLCSKSSCRKCSGEYAIDMQDFLDVYTEMKMAEEEYQCEYVREHCYCSSGYYESCLSTCYSNAGLDQCMQQYYGGQSFQLQEYIECSAAFQNGNNNNNNNGNRDLKQKFYVGPYCHENQMIYLGAFYDETCTYQADTDTFQSQNYGDGFPYMTEPLLAGSECFSCAEIDEYDDDQYQDNEANELCQTSVEESIKCDSGRGYSSGCYFMENTLPCLDGRGCVEESQNEGGTGTHDMTTSELYQEMAKRLKKNKRVAMIMGGIAGALLLALAGVCMWCCCQPSLLKSSKKNPLLQRRANQKAVSPAMQQ